VVVSGRPADLKAALRGPARARRDAIPAEVRAAAAAAIAARVDAELLAPLPAGALVCLYDAIGSEVATRPLAARVLARGLGLAYPRLVPGAAALVLHRATPDQLAPGTLRIGEPPTSAPPVPPGEVALVLLPGLAFDRRGVRLGWGRGHYDATFAQAPERPRAGLAFEAQLVERLPSDRHDLPVHLIVTEAALHRCPEP
jgi:5-formyltetrahydrofolate cyclo-ligase